MRTTLLSCLCLSVLLGSLNFLAAKKLEGEITKAPSLEMRGRRFALLYLGGGDLVRDPTSPYDALLKDEFDQLPPAKGAVLFAKKTGNDLRAYVCKTGDGSAMIVTTPQVEDGVIIEMRKPDRDASMSETPDAGAPSPEKLERPAWRIVCPDNAVTPPAPLSVPMAPPTPAVASVP